MGLLQATAEPAREILGVETIDVVADTGHQKTKFCELFAGIGSVNVCETATAF